MTRRDRKSAETKVGRRMQQKTDYLQGIKSKGQKRKKSSRMQQEGWKKWRNDLRALLVSPSLSE